MIISSTINNRCAGLNIPRSAMTGSGKTKLYKRWWNNCYSLPSHNQYSNVSATKSIHFILTIKALWVGVNRSSAGILLLWLPWVITRTIILVGDYSWWLVTVNALIGKGYGLIIKQSICMHMHRYFSQTFMKRWFQKAHDTTEMVGSKLS